MNAIIVRLYPLSACAGRGFFINVNDIFDEISGRSRGSISLTMIKEVTISWSESRIKSAYRLMEIKGYVSDAKSAVLVDYRGLTVEQDTKLRKQLRRSLALYTKYTKDTTLHLAFDGTDFAQLDKDLEGPTSNRIRYRR